MALREINEKFTEIRKAKNDLSLKRDSLLAFYDALNKPLPEDVVYQIRQATIESEEYRSERERFVNRVSNFKEQMINIGFSEELATAVVKDFTEFLRKN